MSEYIAKRMSAKDLEAELLALIKRYNQLKGTFLLVYSSAISKPIPQTSLSMDDYFTIFDILKNQTSPKLDLYIETPGGSGEAAEEIVCFLRKKFKEINFVISGEAKSAGTIMVLSGDKISMTESGSLGPIDAQVRVGRSQQSAFDYMDWIKKKRNQAARSGKLNPFDATMVAQISPGELRGVDNALNFAQDLVVKWLPKYLFRNWKESKEGKIVTQVMKEKKAKKVVNSLINHNKWRSHGRSIKIDDLEMIGLPIERIDKDAKISEVVYRIQTVIRMLYSSTNAFKMFATQDEKIFANATAINSLPKIDPKNAQVAEVIVECPKCKAKHNLYMKFVDNPKIDEEMRKSGKLQFPKDNKLVCSCGFEIDLSGLRNNLETQTGKKVLV